MVNSIDWQFDQLEELQENIDLEIKLARGKNGTGTLPNDFWPTYSAMANTCGGLVLLGLRETKSNREFEIVGISDTSKVIKELWDGLNNPKNTNCNILSDNDVSIREIGDKKVIQILIPEASRKQKPVFIKGNPYTGTYQRNFEGDFRCPEETVRRMMAEQVEDSRDARLLEGFKFEDFDTESLKVYRNLFQNLRPDHPWNGYEMLEFLRSIGAWSINRKTGDSAPTLAGILMFGKLRSILDAAPNYIVDYQERPQAKTEARWIDRLTTDGTWSGNLFDFYRLVIKRLFSDLKVPFALKGDKRIEETPVHVALRESLVNTLIHADYSGRASVLVVKRPDLFGFRNPGGSRIPLTEAKKGGNSDCRNRNLQKMFQLVGLGEQAGSGVPKIYSGWTSQHWRKPELTVRVIKDREETILSLGMLSLLPEETIQSLGEEFGERFFTLPETERIALVTSSVEGSLTHSRLSEITYEHSHDLTRMLHELVENRYLESDGRGRGKFYFLPGRHPDKIASDAFENPAVGIDNELAHKESEVAYKSANLSHKQQSSKSGIDNDSIQTELVEIAKKVSETRRAEHDLVRNTIIKLCSVKELSSQEIAELLNRDEKTIRNSYIGDLCNGGYLKQHYSSKHHPKQRYKTVES